MLRIVSFLHVFEASIIDVTSVSGVGDGYCATLIAQSFYRMPASKTYSCQNHAVCIVADHFNIAGLRIAGVNYGRSMACM